LCYIDFLIAGFIKVAWLLKGRIINKCKTLVLHLLYLSDALATKARQLNSLIKICRAGRQLFYKAVFTCFYILKCKEKFSTKGVKAYDIC
jgi:hypothetical protein